MTGFQTVRGMVGRYLEELARQRGMQARSR